MMMMMMMTAGAARTACRRSCRHQIVAVSVDQTHGVAARRALHARIVLVVMDTSFAVTESAIIFGFETGDALCEFGHLVGDAAADAVAAENYHAAHGGRAVRKVWTESGKCDQLV